MAAIEINVSVPLLQPSIRHRGNHSRQTFARCIPRAPPSLKGPECLASSKHSYELRHTLQVAMRPSEICDRHRPRR